MRRIVGPNGGGFEPRGIDAKPECNLSENITSCQNGIVLQRTNANEAAWRRFMPAI
jgi:hypothetical protein